MMMKCGFDEPLLSGGFDECGFHGSSWIPGSSNPHSQDASPVWGSQETQTIHQFIHHAALKTNKNMMYSPFYLALLGSAAATAVVPSSVAKTLGQAHRKLQSSALNFAVLQAM